MVGKEKHEAAPRAVVPGTIEGKSKLGAQPPEKQAPQKAVAVGAIIEAAQAVVASRQEIGAIPDTVRTCAVDKATLDALAAEVEGR